MYEITINAHELVFYFPIEEESGAWYDLDNEDAYSDGWKLHINADRDVYASLTDPNGNIFYGTIGDAENELLADNFIMETSERYLFYDHPETEFSYL